MQVSDNTAFRHRLEALAEVFNTKLSAARIALYFEALRDLDLSVVVAALNDAVKVCKFFPKPAELREFALGNGEDRTETAWLAFRKAMKVAGSYASVSLLDAALAETVIAMFGTWPGACSQELSPEMWASKRKEFGRVYHVQLGRELQGGRYLPGTCELTNSGRSDWMKFVPVHRVDATGVSRQLSRAEADRERQLVAAISHGLSQLTAGVDLSSLGLAIKETA